MSTCTPTNRELSKAFDRWAEMATEAKEMRIKLRRYLLRMQKKELSDAFTLWCDALKQSQTDEATARFQAQLNALEAQRWGGAS